MAYGTIKVDTIENTNGLTGNAIGPGFKNRIINGSMMIDQRNAGASVTPADGAYTIDRWNYNATQASKMSVQRSTTAPTGFSNSMLITTTTAVTVGAGDTFSTIQCIEGFNFADMMWGTANAKTITMSFWVRSSLTGTFGGALLNSAQNRSYPFTYTINAADTWENKSVTIAGDTTGTWIGATNGIGVRVCFDLGAGSTYSGTAGAWTGSTKYAATGSVSVVGTLNATWYITGVQLEVGPSATSFDYRPYGTELALCQRYLPAFNATAGTQNTYFGQAVSTSQSLIAIPFLVLPRATPTGITVSSAGHFSIYTFASGGGAATSITFDSGGTTSSAIRVNTTAGTPTIVAGGSVFFYANNASGQLLFTGCEL